jgi:DNA-binding response OmpR family regulator
MNRAYEARAVSTWRVLLELHGGRDVTGVAHALRVAGLYDVDVYEAGRDVPFDDHDLIILVDTGIPRRALERLQRARSQCEDKPIVVLSDDRAPESAAACLHAGAIDVVSLPFIGYELLQRIFNWLNFRYRPRPGLLTPSSGFRIKAVSSAPGPLSSSESAPAIVLDENGFTVTIGGRANSFTEVTYRVVEYLVRRAGTWVRSPELQRNAIGAHAKADASNVRFHVHKAREQFEFGGFDHFIHSWPRRGYMWSLEQCATRHCSGRPGRAA